ncbi:MAG: DUF4105 domain-containing protein, partial [Spirochaetales bacterium]|nr:DUF4105 domain-containing protein [Spirochaetales bacterium]
WWGHISIIVEDSETGNGRSYDYGNFSFNEENFVRNFVMGRLYFLKISSRASYHLKSCKHQNRDVTIYTLNVPPENKLKIIRFLENDVKAENRIYLYDHFYDNCSTRIRDEMDILTDGEFSKTFKVPSGMTLRQQLRRFSYRHHFMDWLLNFAISGIADKEITYFDGMYLPQELGVCLEKMVIHNADGSSGPFVINKEIYNKAFGRPEIPAKAPPQWQYGLIIGFIFALIAFILLINAEENPLKLKLTAIYSMLFSFVAAIPGSLLFFMAGFTDHAFAYWNMNLLFMNPLLFVVFAFSIRTIVKGQKELKALKICWTVVSAAIILDILLKIVPACRQENWESILIMLLPSLALSLIPGLLRKNSK